MAQECDPSGGWLWLCPISGMGSQRGMALALPRLRNGVPVEDCVGSARLRNGVPVEDGFDSVSLPPA